MKKVVMISLFLVGTLNAGTSIICNEDNRMAGGSLNIAMLTPGENGFTVQTQFVASLNTPNIEKSIWGSDLACKIDDKTFLAYCESANGADKITISERREVFLDSLLPEDKKKTAKYIDISLYNENSKETKSLSFSAGDCRAS